MSKKNPSKGLQMLVGIMLPAITQLGENALVDVLQDFHDKNPDLYKRCLRAGHEFIEPLAEFVKDTKTKIDDGFVEALHNAIDLSAENNGVELLEA